MEVHGANFHFIATKRKFTARTFISSPRNGSSRHELPFHPHEMEVHGANFHFIPTKRKFVARTFISSPRNGSSRHELPFHPHEMEVHVCCRDHKESVTYRSFSRQVQARV